MKRKARIAFYGILIAGVLAMTGCRNEILPLPVEVDLDSIPDGEYEADIKNIDSDANGISADFTLYTMDLYDAVDMNTIAAGDVVHINMGTYGEEVIKVSKIEHKEVVLHDSDEKRDVLIINDGIEEGGAEFVAYEGGTYRYFGMDDYATSTKHGTVNLKIADDAKIVDTSDLWMEDADPNGKLIKTADLPELTKDDTEEDYTFSSLGTTVRTENGVVVEITKVYRP